MNQAQNNILHIRPVGANTPVARPFPLKWRQDSQLCVRYFESDDLRTTHAIELVTSGVRGCVMLPKITKP